MKVKIFVHVLQLEICLKKLKQKIRKIQKEENFLVQSKQMTPFTNQGWVTGRPTMLNSILFLSTKL